MPRCVNCGAELHWQSDFNGDECGYEEGGVVSVWTCPECGAEHQVYIPSDFKTDEGV